MADLYSLGNTLILELENQDMVEAEIIQEPNQFTLSCVVIVRLNHPRLLGPFALKLYDRIYASQLREEEKQPWNTEVELAYQEFIASGLMEPFLHECESNFKRDEYWADNESQSWSKGKREAYLQYLCWRIYDTERFAYQLLKDLQGKHIPKIFGFPRFRTSSRSESKVLNKYLQCPGILLEYIPGYSLSDLANRTSKEDWQIICEEAIRVVHLVSQKGVCNRDVKPRNFIVRPAEGSKSSRVVQIDFGLCYFRARTKSDREFRELQADEDEEGAVGRGMEIILKGGFKYQRSLWSRGLLDEFKRE